MSFHRLVNVIREKGYTTIADIDEVCEVAKSLGLKPSKMLCIKAIKAASKRGSERTPVSVMTLATALYYALLEHAGDAAIDEMFKIVEDVLYSNREAARLLFLPVTDENYKQVLSVLSSISQRIPGSVCRRAVDYLCSPSETLSAETSRRCKARGETVCQETS